MAVAFALAVDVETPPSTPLKPIATLPDGALPVALALIWS
jgi:hypothetical protein